MNHQGIKAFTLIEIMIVCVILGILTTLALPLYQKTVDTGRQNDAKIQLQSIWAANQMYKSRSGKYWPVELAKYGLEDINTNLHLNILGNKIEYKCTGDFSGSTFQCVAYPPPMTSSWCYKVTEMPLSDTNPNYYAPGNNCLP